VEAFWGVRRMRAILLTVATCLLAGCMSLNRVREAHCLGAMMMETLEAKNDLESAEDAWRAAQQARFERSRAGQPTSSALNLISNRNLVSSAAALVPRHAEDAGNQAPEADEERALYGQVVAAQARYRRLAEWYGRVLRRVQTRLEEDDMLYPVLGMLVTSPGIVFYPLVRWNVRSVLWDGVDPDAEDDAVQVFCTARLGQEIRRLHP
jgi:outer membrane murein-binding lipoprotein Lpp